MYNTSKLCTTNNLSILYRSLRCDKTEKRRTMPFPCHVYLSYHKPTCCIPIMIGYLAHKKYSFEFLRLVKRVHVTTNLPVRIVKIKNLVSSTQNSLQIKHVSLISV